MPRLNLTDRTLKGLKPQSERVEYWDSSEGFGVRITPNGAKSFCVMYRIDSHLRRYTLGRYPQISLARAREMAKDAFEQVRKGKDPAQEKKAAEAAASRKRLAAKTFDQLSRQYIEEYAKPNKKSWREDERIIERLLKPEFGTLNVKEITRSHVRSFLRNLAGKTKVQANRAQACMRKIFNWTIQEEIADLESNPASGISSPGGREKPKLRSLNDDEIRKVWKELDKEESQVKHVLRLILLTGQRPGEVMGMSWDEIDFNQALWTIPGSRTKNESTQIVPLSTQAIRILERQRDELAAQRQKRIERQDGAPESPFVFPNRLLAKYSNAPINNVRKAVGRLQHRLDIKSFSAHDLRRTCATNLGQMLVPGHVIARILNHKQKDVTSAVYNQYDYVKEKRDALEAWGKRVAQLVSRMRLVEPDKHTGV